MSRQLVVLGEDWGAHPSSTQHLIRRLLPDYRVLWVNSIGLRAPGWRDLGRIGRKLCAATTDASSVTPPPGMEVLSPLALPWHGQEWVRRVNGPWLARQIRRRAPWLERPLLWLSLPSAIALAGHLGEQAIIYYCGDDFGALEGVDHAMARECEQALVARASPALAERFPAHKTRLLPHGVDLDRFSAGGQRPADLPHRRLLWQSLELDRSATAGRNGPGPAPLGSGADRSPSLRSRRTEGDCKYSPARSPSPCPAAGLSASLAGESAAISRHPPDPRL